MTQTANNYATVLLELGVTREAVDETKEILSLTQDLPKSLKSPVVSKPVSYTHLTLPTKA